MQVTVPPRGTFAVLFPVMLVVSFSFVSALGKTCQSGDFRPRCLVLTSGETLLLLLLRE